MSLSDWEFEPGNEYFLDESQYVSAPSSLCAPIANTATSRYYIFLKSAIDGNIPNGRIITYLRKHASTPIVEFYFRQQEPLVHNGNQNGYVVRFWLSSLSWDIKRFLGGVATPLYTGVLTLLPSDAWHRVRLDFYEYEDPPLGSVLRIELFIEIDGIWVSQGHFDDGNHIFGATGTARVGFAFGTDSMTTREWADDTQIWKET